MHRMADAFEPHNVLVTGGCGFMGSNFVRYVVREHPDVCVAIAGQADLRRIPPTSQGCRPSAWSLW